MERDNKKHRVGKAPKRTWSKPAIQRVAPQRRAQGIMSVSLFQPARPREKKFVDVNSTQSPAIAGTGTLSAGLCLLAVGTTASQRVGNEVNIKSMAWRQECSLATTTGNGAIRTVLIYDKHPNGAAPTISGTPATDIFNQDNIRAEMFLPNRDRYIVLQDIITPSVGTAGPGADYQKGYRKMALPQVYNAGTATIGALNSGNIVAVTWCSPGFAVAPPTVTLQTRFRYEDA